MESLPTGCLVFLFAQMKARLIYPKIKTADKDETEPIKGRRLLYKSREYSTKIDLIQSGRKTLKKHH